MTKQTFEKRVEALLKPLGDGPFDITAFELTRDDCGWSVNTPFSIGVGRPNGRNDPAGNDRTNYEN